MSFGPKKGHLLWLKPAVAREHGFAMRLVGRVHVSARRPVDPLVGKRMPLPLGPHAIGAG